MWVDEGKTDEWIADALGTSASSVQSFRSRNDIYRRERSRSEPESVFEGVLDHGERDGLGHVVRSFYLRRPDLAGTLVRRRIGRGQKLPRIL